MSTLEAVVGMIRDVRSRSKMKVNRSFDDFFADRIVQSFSGATIVDCIEHLAMAVDASICRGGDCRISVFMTAASSDDAAGVLAWIREHPRIVAMIAALKNEDEYREAVLAIVLDAAGDRDDSVVTAQPVYEVGIEVELLSPLAHGADVKAGNATLFRRRQVITDTGRILSIPFYSGNAVRGQMRDLLADHFLESLGLTPRRDDPPVALWFFHALYAGGVLEEKSKATAMVEAELGKSGAIRTEGLRRFRDMIPPLSLLGCAIGNRVIPGRICVGDLRPRCREWGLGSTQASELMEWLYLTRRDDHEGRSANDAHTGMIATTECLRDGVRLVGGVDIDTHAGEIERSALGLGLDLLANHGMLGADNRRGLGKARFRISGFQPDPAPYQAWIDVNRQDILDYLDAIGALA